MRAQDVYTEPIIINTKGAIIRVYKPILTPEEEARRMKLIHDAAAELLKWKAANNNGDISQ